MKLDMGAQGSAVSGETAQPEPAESESTLSGLAAARVSQSEKPPGTAGAVLFHRDGKA